MKKALILAAVAASAVSSLANATAVCAGAPTGGSVAMTVNTTPTNGFFKVAFTAKCSANVFSNYSETGVAFGVVAGSAKGKNYFGGSTGGGGVRPMGTCATTGCSTTEVSDGNSTAAMNAS